MPRPSRRQGDAARHHADTLRFVLFEARPAGLDFPQLVRASDLPPSQARSGLAALKDQAAENGWPPLTWSRQSGYRLGAERAADLRCPGGWGPVADVDLALHLQVDPDHQQVVQYRILLSTGPNALRVSGACDTGVSPEDALVDVEPRLSRRDDVAGAVG